MSTDQPFSISIYEEQTHNAERELAEFLSAVMQQYGPLQTHLAGKDWLDESELMDTPPLSTSRNWHAVTIAASARLADEIAAWGQSLHQSDRGHR